jgi:hypothetical protein
MEAIGKNFSRVWENSKTPIKTFCGVWAISIVVLFFPCWAIDVLGWQSLPLWRFLGAAALLGAVFSLLLELDQKKKPGQETFHQKQEPAQDTAGQKQDSAQQSPPILTWSGLTYELFVLHKSLVAFFALAIGVTIIAGYYVVIWLFNPHYEIEAGVLTISLPFRTIYYVPISPMASPRRSVDGRTRIYCFKRVTRFPLRCRGAFLLLHFKH